MPDDWFAKHDVHVHVPAGAIPKDGPSAGITMATALMSLVSGRPVRDDVAMTGELTLTGQVLPIGGLKEKALAAQRAGIRRVLAPRRNEADLEDLPEPLRKDMDFVWVGEIGEVFAEALSDAPPTAPHRVCSCKRTRRGGMAKAQNKAKQAQAAAMKARNPYVRRIMEDEDLRQNITDAYTSARKAYGRLSNGKSPTKQIFDDKKLQKELKSAAESIKDARRRAAQAEEEEGRRRRQAAAARRRQRRRRARGQRGPAQEGARRAVRRRGGVRVQLDHHGLDPTSEAATTTSTYRAPCCRATQLSGSSGMSHHRIASTHAPIASAVAMPRARAACVVRAAFS